MQCWLGRSGNVISIPYPNNILADIFRAIGEAYDPPFRVIMPEQLFTQLGRLCFSPLGHRASVTPNLIANNFFFQEVLRVWFGWVRLPTFLRKRTTLDRSEPSLDIRSQESTLKERQSDVESLVDMYFTPPSEARTSFRSGGDLSSARAVTGHITSTDWGRDGL